MNVSVDARAFADEVKGVVKARFRLNQDGTPWYEQDEDDPELRHYTIFLSLESPRARRIDTVSYFMDHETFSDDPLAVSDNPNNHFREVISSYGDVEVEVTAQMGANVYKQRCLLSDLLEAGHAGDASPAVREAIERIRKN